MENPLGIEGHGDGLDAMGLSPALHRQLNLSSTLEEDIELIRTAILQDGLKTPVADDAAAVGTKETSEPDDEFTMFLKQLGEKQWVDPKYAPPVDDALLRMILLMLRGEAGEDLADMISDWISGFEIVRDTFLKIVYVLSHRNEFESN